MTRFIIFSAVCVHVWVIVHVCLHICVYVSVCQGVKGCTVPSVERLISVSPSCQPAVIEVSYVNGDGQTVSVENNQDVIGVCGDTIRRLSKSAVDSITLLSR